MYSIRQGSKLFLLYLRYLRYVPFTFTAYSVLNPDRHITGIKVKKIMTQYALYTFGGAALIVGINIISTLVVSEFKLSGYYKKSTLLIFMCVTNILFYFLTAYKFVSAPSVEKEAGNTSRLHFTVYVKLFSLTGLSWVLQIVDIFVELSFFTCIVCS